METNKYVNCYINDIKFCDITVGDIINVPKFNVGAIGQEFVFYGDAEEFVYFIAKDKGVNPNLVVSKIKWRDSEGYVCAQTEYISESPSTEVENDTASEFIEDEEFVSAVECSAVDLDSMTKKELVEYVNVNSIDVNTKLKKADLLLEIKAAVGE